METKKEKPESMAAAKRREQAEAIERLRKLIEPGSTVRTMLKHVSRSGMYRRIAVIICSDGEPENISGLVATACGLRWHDDGSVGMGGCGMDMGFAVVYDLSRTLWPKGAPCIGEKCPSNDHDNGDRDYTPHVHRDGGYTLRHRWL